MPALPQPLSAPFRVHVFASDCTQFDRAYRAAFGPRVALVPRQGRALVGQGCAVRLQGTPSEVLAQLRLAPDLAQRLGKQAQFVGGLSFDTTRAPGGPWAGLPVGHFVLPRLQWLAPHGDQPATVLLIAHEHESHETLRREHAAFEARCAAPAHVASPNSLQIAGDPRQARAAWDALVHAALSAFADRSLRKVVAARELQLQADRAIEPSLLLEALSDTAALRFALDIHDAAFVGGSPELLVRKRGASLATEALAGSEPRHGGSDAEEIERLLGSQKDRREHAFVVDAIAAALEPWIHQLKRPEAPSVRTLPTVHHLHMPIEAELAREAHVLELLESLHPTPAVCGTPQQDARRWLAEHEGLERGYYAGPVGSFDAHGDGEFHVALRSGLLRGDCAHLYAGAGLVPGSEPAREFAEVEAKLQVMRNALQAMIDRHDGGATEATTAPRAPAVLQDQAT